MKILCVYYSRTGKTKEIAELISKELGAELLEITDGKDRSGFFGYIFAALAGLRRRPVRIRAYVPMYEIESYDKLIICSPIWCEKLCPQIRAFVKENEEKMKHVSYVLTHKSAILYEESIDGSYDSYISLQTKNDDWTKDMKAFFARERRSYRNIESD